VKNEEEEAMAEEEVPIEGGEGHTAAEGLMEEVAADGSTGGEEKVEVMNVTVTGDPSPWRRAKKWTLQSNQ